VQLRANENEIDKRFMYLLGKKINIIITPWIRGRKEGEQEWEMPGM
jgi:hypothetical protein